jgi:hypothetical protein
LIFGGADVTDISKFPEGPIMAGCSSRYFRLAAKDIARFQFILEGHEGIATVSTVDAKAAVVKLCTPVGLEGDVECVLEALTREMGLDFLEVHSEGTGAVQT